MIAYSFPKIEKYMSDAPVEWALVHALIRQESRYDQRGCELRRCTGPDAAYAAHGAGSCKEGRKVASEIMADIAPEHNIALGSRYINSWWTDDGNYAMALWV